MEYRRSLPWPKVLAYDIDEAISKDVAKVDRNDNRVKFLLVAVDISCRELRVLKSRTKTAQETAQNFPEDDCDNQITESAPDNWPHFKCPCNYLYHEMDTDDNTQPGETNSAFAQRNIRPHGNLNLNRYKSDAEVYGTPTTQEFNTEIKLKNMNTKQFE